MQPLRVVFIVQGEGRGHMTQALALASYLRDAGHEITRVLVGRSPWRSIPNYFSTGIAAPVSEFDAPAQVPGSDGRGLSALRTAADVAARTPAFVRAMRQVSEATQDADVVVNFLDLMGGLSRLTSPSPVPALAVAHNYLFLHPALESAPGPQHVRRAVLSYAEVTTAGATSRVALSFDELPDAPSARLTVAPPLLRPGLGALSLHDGGYLLAYVLNAGYGGELAAWQARHPDVDVHCYLEGGASAAPFDYGEGFQVHGLDADAFLDHLAGCRAYVGSAGFESLCEAHWLGKPILAVPTDGQFEQTLNAWDAERCGIARGGTYADLDEFWQNPGPPPRDQVEQFRRWVARAPEVLVAAVEETAHIRRS
jgi:hypothetical protein